jgi:two-component system, cell cycle sensor histidine kinase DivJ
VGLLKPIQDYIDSLVHPSAQRAALTAARHRVFIATRLLSSFVGLAAFPLYLAMRGVPSALEVVFFSWLVPPIAVAYFLSRTGQYEKAYIFSSLSLTGLIAVLAFKTGGISSFAAIWLLGVPLEAALSGLRRVVALASTFVLAATGILILSSAADLLPNPATAPSKQGALAALGILFTSLYAAGLSLMVARAEFRRANAPKSRTALGISIVKRLVALHAGEVGMRSVLGEEAQITVHLPFDREVTPTVMKGGTLTHPSFRLEQRQPAIVVRKRA